MISLRPLGLLLLSSALCPWLELPRARADAHGEDRLEAADRLRVQRALAWFDASIQFRVHLEELELSETEYAAFESWAPSSFREVFRQTPETVGSVACEALDASFDDLLRGAREQAVGETRRLDLDVHSTPVAAAERRGRAGQEAGAFVWTPSYVIEANGRLGPVHLRDHSEALVVYGLSTLLDPLPTGMVLGAGLESSYDWLWYRPSGADGLEGVHLRPPGGVEDGYRISFGPGGFERLPSSCRLTANGGVLHAAYSYAETQVNGVSFPWLKAMVHMAWTPDGALHISRRSFERPSLDALGRSPRIEVDADTRIVDHRGGRLREYTRGLTHWPIELLEYGQAAGEAESAPPSAESSPTSLSRPTTLGAAQGARSKSLWFLLLVAGGLVIASALLPARGHSRVGLGMGAVLVGGLAFLPLGARQGTERASAAVAGLAPRQLHLVHRHDFGEVAEGESREVTISVVNKTSRPWKLKGAHSSCGCLKVLTFSPVTNPGDSLVATVRFDSTAMTGSLERLALFEMAASREVLAARFFATVVRPLRATPAALTIRNAVGISAWSSELELVAPGSFASPSITVERRPEWLTVGPGPWRAAGAERVSTIHLRAERLPKYRESSYLVLRLAIEKAVTTVAIPIAVVPPAALAFSSEVVALQRKGDSWSGSVWVAPDLRSTSVTPGLVPVAAEALSLHAPPGVRASLTGQRIEVTVEGTVLESALWSSSVRILAGESEVGELWLLPLTRTGQAPASSMKGGGR